MIYDQSHGVLGAAGFEHCQLCDLFYFWLGRHLRCQGLGTTIATHLQRTLNPIKHLCINICKQYGIQSRFSKSRMVSHQPACQSI